MKKRFLSILLSSAMALSLLSGCAGGGSSSENTTAAADAATGDKPYAGQTLSVLYMSSVYADAAKSMVAEFEEKTGAKVEVVDFPYTTLHEKALLDLTSGTGSYDVIDVASQWDGEFAPYMTDLSSYIEKDGYKMDEFIEKVLENSGTWQGLNRLAC